jgi:hypothetical protein
MVRALVADPVVMFLVCNHVVMFLVLNHVVLFLVRNHDTMVVVRSCVFAVRSIVAAAMYLVCILSIQRRPRVLRGYLR